jgi:CheY-like chemotaxis protein
MTEMHEFSQQPLVLIVDDQSSNRSIVRRYVEAAGYLAAEAEHGVAALDFVRQTPPDAILLDIFMPGIDGIEVLKTIRAQRDHHYITIIVVSDCRRRISGTPTSLF